MVKSYLYKLKKNVYQYFLMKLFVLFITVVFLDFIIGSLLNIFYFRQDSGMQYRATYSIEKTTADLLVFGSSTANHNYHPEIFEPRLKMSFYNAGRDGISILYAYAVLKGILKRYSPKMVILDFDPGEFVKDQVSYDRLSSLLPYYKNHPEFRSVIELKSNYEQLKLLSYIYPFNSSILTIAIGNIDLNKKRRGDINGYIPLTNIWDEPIKDGSTFVNHELDSNKIRLFKCFIESCISSKVQLYIVCSPLFLKPDYESNSILMGKEIANKYNIKFLDYSKDAAFLNSPVLFADKSHLNSEGAKIFSNKLIDSMLTIVPKSLPDSSR